MSDPADSMGRAMERLTWDRSPDCELAQAIRDASQTDLTHRQMLTWVRRCGRPERTISTKAERLIANLNRRLDEETRDHILTVARLEVAEAEVKRLTDVLARADLAL